MLDIHMQSLCQRGKLFSFLSWDLKVKLEVQHKMLLQCTDYFVIFIVLKSPEFRKQSLWNSNFSGGGHPDPPLWLETLLIFEVWGLKVGKYTKQPHLKVFPWIEPSTKRGTHSTNGRWWGRSGPKCQGRFFVPLQSCILPSLWCHLNHQTYSWPAKHPSVQSAASLLPLSAALFPL